MEDLVALLQTHNAQKSQEPAPAESPREPERQHPWIPNVWRRDASRKPETGPRPFNDMTPNVVGPSTSNPGWQEMVVTPATTANSTCSPLTPSSRLPDLPPAMAEAVLHEFRTVYTKNNPFLYIHPSVTVQEMQQERPFLWLVIRALCTKSYAEHHELGRLIREVLSNQLLVECERNLDLLLCLLTYMGWTVHWLVGRPFMCVLSSLASALVLDLRLDRKSREDVLSNPNLSCFKQYPFPRPGQAASNKARTNEERRAVLGCYFTSSIASIYMKYEAARWKPHIEKYMDHLWEESEAPTDRTLVALIRITNIGDESTQLTMRSEDSDASSASMFHIKGLLASLDQVKSTFTPEVLNHSLVKLHIYSTEVVIYEPAIFQQASTPPFKPLDFRRRGYLQACLESTKNFLDCFISLDAAEYVGLSFWCLIEFAYCTQALYRLSLLDDPGWDRAATRQTADIIYYLEETAKLFDRMHNVARTGLETPDEDDIFSKAAWSLRTTIPSWASTLEQVGAVTATPSNAATTTAAPAMGTNTEAVDPMLMDFTDDFWLADMFTSWGGAPGL